MGSPALIEQLENRQLFDATLTFGAKETVRFVTFVDADGTSVRMSLAGGGIATAVIAGTDIVQTPTGKGVALSGTGLNINSLTIDGAVNARLLIQAFGGSDGFVNVDALTANGTMAAVVAPQVNLRGPATGDFTLLQLGAVTSTTITDTAAPRPMSVKVTNHIYDSTFTTPGRINTFYVGAFQEYSTIDAYAIGQFTVPGEFTGTLNLSSTALALGSAKVGDITDGRWEIQGSIGRIVANSSDSNWTFYTPGHIGFLSINSFRGEVTATSAGVIQAKTMTNVFLDIVRPYNETIALQRLAVSGTVSGSFIGVDNNVGAIVVGQAVGTYFSAGVGQKYFAEDLVDYVSNTSINSFRSGSFWDSALSSARLGNVNLGTVVDASGTRDEFGVHATLAKLVSGTMNGKKFAINHLGPLSDTNYLLAKQGVLFSKLEVDVGLREPIPNPEIVLTDPGNDPDRLNAIIFELADVAERMQSAQDSTAGFDNPNWDQQRFYDFMNDVRQGLVNCLWYRDRMSSPATRSIPTTTILNARNTAVLVLETESDLAEVRSGAYAGFPQMYDDLAAVLKTLA